MGNCIDILKRFLAILVFCFSALMSFGEGSKNLHPSGATGNRASLLSTTTTGDIAVNPVVGIRFPNPGRHFVYAKVGEVIHVGSSAQGIVGTGSVVQTGTINLVAPDGSTYTSGTSTTVGRIAGRSAELVGPTLDGGVDGGYTAYTVTVASGQEGIWVVDFIAPSSGVGGADALNATNLTANASWTTANQQTNSRYIVAWDATVVSSGTRLSGRVYQTVFSADLSQAQNQFCHQGKFIVLSKDGYQYLVEPQTGFQPFQFAFFANNKGLRYNTGANIGVSAFRSAPNASVENASSNPALAYDYHTPNSADDATNITHKIFYNSPDAANLTETANIATSIYGTSSTWLYKSVPVVPSLSDLTLVGKEGTSGKFSTTAPLTGGFINFTSNLAGSYRILIDANNDGDYTDAVDLTIRGDAVAGANSVTWDGKDGQGNFIVNGGNIKINAVTLAGEVHFPLADAEKNVNGIKFTRINGTGSPNYTIYWDDNLLTYAGTAIASSPTTNLDNGSGQSSETNGHKWGLNAGVAGAAADQFGNEAVIDTWMNVFSTEQNLNVTINYQEADLEIVSLVGDLTNICVGTEVTYTFVARNNGPNNSGDATVSFVFPTELTNLSIISATVTSGTATGVGGTFSGTTFTDVLNMDNGAVVTYVVKGTIGSYPSGGNLNTSARILRAADVTDPDATNDDVAPPTDPISECNGSPSGAGCNNIKSLTTVVQALPSTANAGSNQVNCNDGSFTLAAITPAVGTGSWSLISGTATITNAALTNTTVTGVPAGTVATLRWTVSNGTCTPTIADVTLTNNNPPSAAVLTTAATLTNCGNGTFNIGAVTPTVGSGQWSVFSGTAVITDANLTSTTVTGVPNGTTAIIRWTVSSAGCTSNMTDVTLTNNPPVSAAVLTTAATLTNCGNGTFNIGAVTPTVGSGQWSVFSGTGVITDANLTSTTVTGVPNGTTAIIRWTVSSAGCTSTMTDVTLTNNPPVSAAVLTTVATLTNCGNGTFNIGAVTPTVGSGQWTVFSGTAVITDANLTSTTVTGVPNGTTAIIRWTVSSAGCTSNITDVTLTNNPPVSAAILTTAATLTNCGNGTFNIGAVTPTVGSGQWSVFSGTAVITDANLTSTTVTGVPNGTTAIIRWTVSSAGCTSTMSDVTLTNNNSPSAAVLTTAATLTNCGNGTFNIGAVTPAVGSGQWSVFSGTAVITDANLTSTTVTGVPNGTTAIIRWTVSSAGCTSTMTDVTLTNNPPVSAAVLTTAATLTNCGNGTFNIGAVTPTVGSGQWTVFSGTAVITDANLTSTTVTGVPNGTTAIIRWTVSSAGCTSTMTDVTLTNNNSPSAAVLTTAATLTNCGNGTFNIGAVTPTVGSGQWTVFSGTAIITDANLTSTTVTGVPNGTTAIIRWTVSGAGCTSTMTDVTLVNNPPVSAAVLTTAATLTNCGNGTFNIGAVTPTVGSGQWSVFSGTAVITDANLTSTTVTGVPNGTTAIIRWTVSSAGCTSTMTDVTLTNNNSPSAAVLTTAATLTNCGNGTFNIGAVTPTVGSGQWSVFSGTAVITDANLTSTTVTGVPNSTTAIIRWTVSSAGCTSTMTDVTLTNNPPVSAAVLTTAATLTNCGNGTFNIGAVTPAVGSGQWTVFSGTAVIIDANLTSTTVTGVPNGTTAIIRWTVSSAGCTSNMTDVTLTNNNSPSAAVLTTAATLTNCGNGTFNIGAVTPTVGSGQWTVFSGTAVITDANLTSTTVTGVPNGTTAIIRWTVSSADCTSTMTDVTLTNNPPVSAAVLTTAATLTNCGNGTFNIGAVTPTVGSGQWSVFSGTAVITDANLTSTTITGVPNGTTAIIRWTVSSAGCTSNMTDVTIINYQAPSTATLISPATLTNCNNGTFNIEAAVPITGTGQWSVMSGIATIANINAASTQVTGIGVGATVVIRWTVSNGTCSPSTVDITLNNTQGPSTANAGVDLANCNNGNFVLAAITPAIGTGVWSVFSGTATITNVNLNTSRVTGIPVGSSATLRWTISSPGCTSNSADIILTNHALPSTANAGTNQTQCNNGGFTMAAVAPTTGTGTWSIVSGTATIANINQANTAITNVPAGSTVTLRWTISNGTCTSTTADVSLTNNNAPSIAVAGTNLTNCNNVNFVLSATSPTVGTGTWSVVSGTAIIANTALTNTTVTGIPAGSSASLRWTVSVPGCTSNSTDIILTNQSLPSIANAGTNQVNCNNGSFTLAAVTPTIGIGNWSIVSGSATIVSSHLTNTTVSGIPVGTTTTLRWSVTNGVCAASTADVILTNAETVNPGSAITISCTTTSKLPNALSGQNWTASSANPSVAVINNNGEITGLISKGIYQFTLSNANCSATVNITKANCPPVALNDTQTVRNDQILTGTLKPKASDTDGDVLVFSVLIPPTRGSIVFNPDGTYTYTPPADYIGNDSLTYRVCDADGLCAEAKLYINITGLPKPPVAVIDSTATNKNVPVSGNVLGNDYNQGTNTNAGLTVTTTPVLPPVNGSVVLNADGTYTYTPANNFTGLDSFRYVICNAAAICDTATVYIIVKEPPALQPKLEIEKRISPQKLKYGTGELVTYTLVAKNTGNTTVNDVSVQDILPPASKMRNVRMVQGSPTVGLASYEAITNVIFWSIPVIQQGDSATLKYTYVLADSGTLVNTATISSPMTNGVTDTASVSIDVVNQADIKITKLLRAPAVISVNDEIGFTMIAENFGPAIGTEVVVQDSLYANLSDPRMMTVNIGKVSYDPVTRKITWRIDTLLVGQKDSLVIRVKVVSGGEIRNGATVKAKQSDPVSGNNGDGVTNTTGGQILIEGREFFIPSVFTPNGDGKNDKFTILGINRFPGSELIIYNRWGNVVYQSKDYKNDWDGRGLNEGTYYYTLNLKATSGSQKMAGWVQILR